jgi:hypothetical protein
MPGGPILPPSNYVGPYPTIEIVFNLFRALVNDTKNNGAGTVTTDSAPFMLPFLNASVGELQRRLQNQSVTTRIATVNLYNFPPINSAGSGVGAPNPAAWQTLSYTGFFDGAQTYPKTDGWFLPPDLIVPIKLSQRQTGTGLQFTEMPYASEGLPSIYQNYTLGQWEWVGDSITWNGCLQGQDIQLRYQQAPAYFNFGLNPSAFPTTMIPIGDGGEALAYLMRDKYESSRLPPGATAPGKPETDAIIYDLANRYSRSRQNKVYEREPFGDETGGYGLPGGPSV